MTADRNPFASVIRSPAYQAREVAYQQGRADRRALVLAKHVGDECAAFRDTEMENALRNACKPLLGPGETWLGLHRLAGWDCCDSFDDMPDILLTVVSDAWPMPKTVEGAWIEFRATEARTADRNAFSEDYSPPAFVEARQRVVQVLLDSLPAKSLADLRTRLSWLDWLNELGAPRVDVQRVRLEILRGDIERIVGGGN